MNLTLTLKKVKLQQSFKKPVFESNAIYQAPRFELAVGFHPCLLEF